MQSITDRLAWKARRFILSRPLKGAAKPPPSSPIVVAGLFSTASGIGESARLSSAALRALGHDPVCVDLSATFNQQDMNSPEHNCAMPSTQSGTLLLHMNAPETERALFELNMRRGRRWRIIGYWAWELEVMPQSWAKAQDYLSEIWTPSAFVTNAVAKKTSIPVHTAPHAVLPPETPVLSHNPDSLNCLIMADGRSSLERKGVLDAVTLFQTAFKNTPSARLLIKTRNLPSGAKILETLHSAASSDARIDLLNRSVSIADKRQLIADCDILLAPHKSEGFGLHLAEAMAMSKVVLSTDWSGNLEFMTPSTSLLVPCDLIPVSDPDGPYDKLHHANWAQPDMEAATKLLRDAAQSAKKRHKLGDAARAHIMETLSPERHLAHL